MTKYISTLFFFLSLGIQAQYKITGKINLLNKPIEYAQVTLLKDSTSVAEAYTDDKGLFWLENITAETYHLIVTYPNTKPYDIKNLIINNNYDLNTINLSLDITTNTSEVVITSQKKLVEYKLDKKVYNVADDKSLIGSSSLDALNNAPLVNVDVEGNVSMRGSTNVKVLIDGRPSSLVSGNDLSALRSIPAESIERIETISVPSARYDADGATGIINIILKKGKKSGVNGALSTTVGHPDLAMINATINYRAAHYNTYLSLGANYNNAPGKGEIYNRYYNGTAPDSISIVHREMNRRSKDLFVNTGIDFYLDKINTLGFNFKYNPSWQTNKTVINYRDYQENLPNQILYTQREDLADNPQQTFEIGTNWTHDFEDNPEHKLTSDIRWSRTTADTQSNIVQTQTLNNVNTIDKQRYTSDFTNNNVNVQLDYVRPLSEKTKLELGAKTEYFDWLNNYKAYDYDATNNTLNPIDFFTHDFVYTQWIHAAYAQTQHEIGNWNMQLGLRVEATRLLLKDVLIDQILYETYKKNYTDIFPSLHLSYAPNKIHSIQFGFSRRINRPRSRMINPFYSLSDNRNVFSGNPALLPVYNNIFEIGYTYNTSKVSLSPSIYYHQSKNPMQIYTQSATIYPNSDTQVIQSFPINLDQEYRYGAELGIQYKPLKWLNINSDINYFQAKVKGSYLGQNLSTGFEGGYFGRLSINTQLPKSFALQLRARYNSENKGFQTINSASGELTATLSKDFLQKKASLVFSVNDILNTNKRGRVSNTDTYYSDSEIQFRTRQFTLNFTYRFGNNPNKKQRNNQEKNSNDTTTNDFGM